MLANERAETPTEPTAPFERFEDRRQDRCRFIVEGSKSVGAFQRWRLPAPDYPGLTRDMFHITAALL